MRFVYSVRFRWLALAIFASYLMAGDVRGQAPASLAKLDRDQLTPLELDMLPDIAVAVVPAPPKGAEVASCAFSPDGKLVTGSRDGYLNIWDLTGAAPRHLQTVELDPQGQHVQPLRFTPDGKRLVAVQAGRVNLYDMTAEGARKFASQEVSGAAHLAIHPTGVIVYSRGNKGHGLSITAKGLEPLPFELQGANSAFAFSPDGGTFAAVVFNRERNGDLYGSEIMFWKVAANRISEYALICLDNGFKTLAFSSDGKWLATGSLDRYVRLWDMGPKQPVEKAEFPMSEWVKWVHFAGGDKYVVGVSSTHQIALYNIAEDKVEKGWMFVPRVGSKFDEGAMSRLFSATAMSPDGVHLAFSNYNSQAVILRLPVAPR